MPGLIRGVARTAAIAGTATAVSNRVSRRQAAKWAEQDGPQYANPRADMAQQQYQEPAPAPAAAPADPIAQLKELGELHQSGVLTDEEFAAQKAKILGS
ncbi:MAG TPA: SHOCT domain-containing protein [Solirubrobacterales bacterium]|nr:SHOCT domain-containing protein [Solirubrobacterales bacterium]HMX72438.1 SHOCT domain-containing protein [Solirubrobacterales bacterium]HNA44668.1 SHOCT domain-containing protein [Solirubrobacterales bacterium]HNC16132.1 SHOCT domain-containing protein [Solirubrobacterales bacterium]HNC94331.1 SHOCT domain-containing protein [Solirubrobacterales bacterium]